MEKIALKSLATWIHDASSDYQQGFGNLIVYGGVSLLVSWSPVCLACPFGLLDLYASYSLSHALTYLLGFIAWGVLTCGLTGVALARIHGREADMIDYWQDLGVHLQSIIATLISYVLVVIVFLLACAPLIATLVSGQSMETTMTIVLVVFALGLGLPLAMVMLTLLMFVVPLIVDKRLDFWSALLQSMDCVRRDFAGLVVLALTIYPAFFILNYCTCGIATLFLAPALQGIIVRAYKDYFGLEADRYRPMQIVGLSHYAGPVETMEYGGRGFAQAATAWQGEQLEELIKSLDAEVAPPPPIPPPRPTWTQLKVPPLRPGHSMGDGKISPKPDDDDDELLKQPPPPPV